jgi:nucleoside-diphosphate-sugar epimerase
MAKREDKGVIIVTGSCGRIGASIVRRLGEEFNIVGFELLKALYATANEELVPVDISSDESVQQAMNHIRYFYGNRIVSVIHLAAYYSFSDQHYARYDAVTVKGTQRLLKALQGFEVEQFIFSSTMLVHKPCQPGQKINEQWPIVPSWAYPLSKVCTEEIIHKERGKIPVVILRIAGVYDDMCHSIPISHQIQRIYEHQLESRVFSGDTSHGASFLHMDDLVDVIELAVHKRHELSDETTLVIGEPVTLSYDYLQRRISRLIDGKEITTFRVPKLVAKIGSWFLCHIPFKEKPFIQPWMISISDDHYELDCSLAQKKLGWVAKRSLDQTLPKMIAALKADPQKWYKQNGLHYKHSSK